uniref:arabinogalactan endo-beta-1,4-galactanase n=1 Tax=Globisporangium ultimum (strain ATCC 200006 / CBS 805.95 / DAOM BR144) TaxID=431595 RepID=K3WHU0_GLOUD
MPGYKAFATLFACFALAAHAATAAVIKGHDLSSMTYMETLEGVTWYSAAGKQEKLETILGEGGMQSVRLRIWTLDTYGLDYTLKLAQRLYTAGYSIYLNMHFSDTWADGEHQLIPAAWNSTDLTELAKDLRTYVKETLEAFTNGGVPIEILSLGNEITSGMLYPLGETRNGNYTGLATLWAASRDGVRDAVATGTKCPQIMIHLDNGWKLPTILHFFEGLFGTGIVKTSDVDVLGFSFYPFYGTGATIEALTTSLTTLANIYKKPIHVAETDYPNECPGVELSTNFSVSTAGQIEWTQAIIKVLEDLPHGLGAGIYYWEPAYVKVASLGSACTSALLFSVDWTYWPNTTATALASVDLFK